MSTAPASIEAIDRFRAEAAAQQVLLHFSGELNGNVVATLSDTVRERLDDSAPDRRIARRVFSAFVEMAQNVLHYAPRDDGRDGPSGTLTVARDAARFSVVCCNRVHGEQIRRVRDRIEAVRAMTLDEIKAAYRAQLRNDEHETTDGTSKGAGLGFLTLAREASEPIDYSIVPIAGQPDSAEFHLRAII
ncbi:MAG: SiaB family protein kinase [Zoogloeaceae bacterium]|nr:SiaB family protein kinase [Zoogloeaceae bacterium]